MLWLDVISNSTRWASFCDMAAPAVSPALSKIVSACSTWMSYATHMDEPSRSYGCDMCWASFWDMATPAVSLALSTADFVMQRVNALCHTYEWVTSHVWMRHATHTNETCHTYEWVMSLIWMSHVLCFFFGTWLFLLFRLPCLLQTSLCDTWMCYTTHMNESSYSYECDMPHILMSHVTHIDESCAVLLFWNMATPAVSLALSTPDFVTRHMKVLCSTYEWVKPYLWMQHATNIDESRYTYGWVMCWASFLGYGYSCCLACLVYCRLRHATREWVVQHIWLSQGIHMNMTSHKNRIHWMRHPTNMVFIGLFCRI